ncbi:hypothetical protein AAFF_G00357590 [Aldrovandia affinis]|uniref:DUF7041 domain-containing protein n=1 Tax=Aldrovandia affinis TaxID=143900 RepID=A0AAD7X0F5_9TELE|nr:hypothetical protein AAFF_G00357590 [Aldrovandia affinis]
MHAVALKLPEFWQEHAAVWFAQAEAQFALRGITQEDTKYFYVVAALNSSTASRVLSLLQDPPEDDKYLALKQLLLETFELSEPERARKLLTLPGLGDSKPSELMDHMLTLLGSPVKDLRALAREADKVLNSSRMPGPAVRVVGAADVLAIREDVIAATQRQRPTAGLCYYHARFGTRAKQCRPPCFSRRKRQSRRPLAALSVGKTSSLLFVTDSVSDRRFLCDTGAQVSVLPASALDVQTGVVDHLWRQPTAALSPLLADEQWTFVLRGNISSGCLY